MESLDAPDLHRLNAAMGWLGLDNLSEARLELDAIAAEQQSHPAVLEVRWLMYVKAGNWGEALTIALRELAVRQADACGWLHRAYALRRLPGGGLQQAWEALLPAAERFPDEPVVAYNLACYACQLGQSDDARRWLSRARELGGKDSIKKMALADDDLKPLWREIAGC